MKYKTICPKAVGQIINFIYHDCRFRILIGDEHDQDEVQKLLFDCGVGWWTRGRELSANNGIREIMIDTPQHGGENEMVILFPSSLDRERYLTIDLTTGEVG